MATTYKVLGQTTATAASSDATVNLITDPVLDNLGNLNFPTNNGDRIVDFSSGLTTWKYYCNSTSTSLIIKSATNLGIAPYAGSNSLVFQNSTGGTVVCEFLTGPATSSTTNWAQAFTNNLPSASLNEFIPVSPSTTYYFGAYLYANSSINLTYRTKFYTSSGTYINHTNHTVTPGNGSWAKANNSITSPANAAYLVITIGGSIGSGVLFGIDNVWFSTDSNASTTFPTPTVLTDSDLLTAPFTSRGTNVWSGTAYASTTVNKFAGALTDVYTVPASSQAVISTLTVANLASEDTTYRVLVLPSGQTAAKKNFIVFDAEITANSTDTITLGMTLNAGDKLQIASDSGNVAATAFGSEIA